MGRAAGGSPWRRDRRSAARMATTMGPAADRKGRFVFTGLLVAAAAAVVVTANGKTYRDRDRQTPRAEESRTFVTSSNKTMRNSMSFLPRPQNRRRRRRRASWCLCITWDLSLLAVEAMFAEGRARTLQSAAGPPLSLVSWPSWAPLLSHFSMVCSTSYVRRHTRVETRCT